MKRARFVGRAALLVVLLVALSFVLRSGCAPWRTPDTGTTRHGAESFVGPTLRVLAFNLAKAGAHRGGLDFASTQDVRAELARIADAIRRERSDLVFLSEILQVCGPCPVDQVRELAELCEMHAWAFGANYDWGLPFFAIRAGNAILSRFPLEGEAVEQLEAGARSFWSPSGNRRVLWARVRIGEQNLCIASVRNDSFDLQNNHAHVLQILSSLGAEPALLAGDFNAEMHDASMRCLARDGRFAFRSTSGGPATWPAHAPRRRIDYVLAPASWKPLRERVLRIGSSDHLAVASVFELPPS